MIDDDDRRAILLTRLAITARHFAAVVRPPANDNPSKAPASARSKR